MSNVASSADIEPADALGFAAAAQNRSAGADWSTGAVRHVSDLLDPVGDALPISSDRVHALTAAGILALPELGILPLANDVEGAISLADDIMGRAMLLLERSPDRSPKQEKAKNQRLYSVVTARESLNLPPVEYRIDGSMPEKGVGAFVGASGDGKGLVSLSWVLAPVLDRPWRGCFAAKPCPAALVIAEGWGGIPQRLGASLDWHQVSDDVALPLYWIPDAPKLNEPADLRRLLETIKSLPEQPRIVGVDTLARTIRGDENKTEDMTAYGDALHAIAEAIDGFVFTIHHTGWDKSRERGNTALRATCDMMALVSRDDSIVTMSCLKMKDGPDFSPLYFRLEPRLDSVVAVPIDDIGRQKADAAPGTARELPRAARTIMETLRDFGDDGASASTLQRTSSVHERSFYRSLALIRRWGFLVKVKQTYQLSRAGKELLSCQ